MDRLFLVISTFCFLFGFGYTMYALGARVSRPSRWNFVAMLAGFLFQTGFLYVRGQQLGRCPISNLFETVVFLCWSMMLFYFIIGSAYRLSLLGTFTSPLVFVLQIVALLLPGISTVPARTAVNPLLELHAAVSVLAYGAFALAFVAGAMYLVQERQLKSHHPDSIFYDMPNIRDLAVANRRLILVGFCMLTIGIIAGVMSGPAHVLLLRLLSFAFWGLYGTLLVLALWHRVTPRKVALLSMSAFGVMLLTLWSVQLGTNGAKP